MQLYTEISPLHLQGQLTVPQMQTPNGVPGILVWSLDRHQHIKHSETLCPLPPNQDGQLGSAEQELPAWQLFTLITLRAHLSRLLHAVAMALLKAQYYKPFPALPHGADSQTETPGLYCARDQQDGQSSAGIPYLEKPQAITTGSWYSLLSPCPWNSTMPNTQQAYTSG